VLVNLPVVLVYGYGRGSCHFCNLNHCIRTLLWGRNLCRFSGSTYEDDYLLVETRSLHITLCNKNSCADVQISITVRIQALRDIFIQIVTDCADKFDCDNCVCKSCSCPDVLMTGGVRLKAARVYHTAAHYRNFEEYEDRVLKPLNISLQTTAI